MQKKIFTAVLDLTMFAGAMVYTIDSAKADKGTGDPIACWEAPKSARSMEGVWYFGFYQKPTISPRGVEKYMGRILLCLPIIFQVAIYQ